MNLFLFEDPAYENLKDNIKNNMQNYLSDNDWLDKYFENQNYFVPSLKDVNQPERLMHNKTKKKSEEKCLEDYANVIAIYGAFKNLTTIQASNIYLWSYLAHTKYRQYVLDRWMLPFIEKVNVDEIIAEDEETEDEKDKEINKKETLEGKIIKRIKTRFLVEGRRKLFDNALSRLWWFGYMTYDEDTPASPWHLTKTLLTDQTICTDVIVNTRCCRNRKAMKGVLLALEEFIGLYGKKNVGMNYYRACRKYLNRYGAVTSIDFLSTEEVKDLAYNFMVAYREKNLQAQQIK